VIEILLKQATHVYAQAGKVSVSEAEASRLFSLGIAEPVKAEAKQEATEEKKQTVKKSKKAA